MTRVRRLGGRGKGGREIPSPSPGGDHFVQSIGGWSVGGFAAMVIICA